MIMAAGPVAACHKGGGGYVGKGNFRMGGVSFFRLVAKSPPPPEFFCTMQAISCSWVRSPPPPPETVTWPTKHRKY